MHESDVILVGSGQAATPLATRFAAAGKTVVLFERGELGGTCINTGCTPTKTMIASARAAHVARTCARLGVDCASVTVDLSRVVARKDAVVRRWREGIASRFAAAGSRLRVVRSHARFVGDRTIEAAGERYRAPIVVLDVGARAIEPSIAGLAAVDWLDNARILNLRQVPPRLIVLGGGYVGCEMGQMFRRFGSEVAIIHEGAHLLSREDADIAQSLEGVFREEGIELRLRTVASEVTSEAGQIAVVARDGTVVRGSHLLVAAGRGANTDGLGYEAGGVRLDARGFIAADDTYATSAPGVYAVGDAVGGPQFTHTSWDDHRRLFDILTKPGAPRRGRSERIIPYTVFTDPQIASAGYNEHQARAKGIPFEMATMPFGDVARAIEVDETAGTMKVLIDPSSERILGVSLVGAEAGELLHVLVALMQAGAKASAIVDAEFVHPTFAEGLQSLVMRLRRYALT
jgi:pyruvate/2-oxoglutarate dehydrogenase complex dihydrolipoamide dehydrogenase (E3) component